MLRSLICAFALLCSSLGHAAVDETWLRVSLDGRKIGHVHTAREVSEGIVISRQTMRLGLERDGVVIELHSDEEVREAPDGQPLAFESRMSMAGSQSRASGKPAADGLWDIDLEQGEHRRSQRMPWPEGALLAEGQRLVDRSARREAGSSYRLLAFDVSSLQILEIDSRIVGREPVTLPEGERQGWRVEQRILMGDAPVESSSWVDDEGELLRSTFSLFGLELELLVCSRECALAPNQPSDVLAMSSVPSPRALDTASQRQPLHYRLLGSDNLAEALGSIPGQAVSALEDGVWKLRIDPAGSSAPAVDEGMRAANRWLQSDDERLIRLAREVTEGAESDLARMQRLEAFVARHIEVKSLRIGYASALEVLDLREGDCTEHSVLLAAMARALGIPAQVATGMAYADAFGGQTRSFIPHAWVMAWVEDGWRGFDAALGEHGSGHIALNLGDGEPFRFYRGIEALGTLRLLAIEEGAAEP